jgi:ABC-type transporter Mla MlaB component
MASNHDGPRHSLLKRIMLYMRKPHLEWEHTASMLSEPDERALRAQFMEQRGKKLTRTDSQRDLDTLRSLLYDRIQPGNITQPTGGGAFPANSGDSPLRHPADLDAPSTAEPERAYALTMPQAPNGAFTLGGDSLAKARRKPGAAPEFAECINSAVFTYASGDDISAEATLLQAIEHHPDKAAELYVYLLDLYQATRQIQPYNAAAQLYARNTGKAMPLWHTPGPRLTPDPRAMPTTASFAAPGNNRYALPQALSAKAAENLLHHVNSQASHDRMLDIDCTALAVVRADACWPLSQAINRLADTLGEVHIAALHKLTQALQSHTPNDNAGLACDWQRAQLALFRLTGNASEYAQTSETFSQRCRLPAPPWMPPRCVLVSSRATVAAAVDHGAASNTLGTHELRLDGSYSRAQLAQTLLAQNAFVQPAQAVQVHCGQLQRLDVDAAHDFIVWTGQLRHAGKQVAVTQLNHLVAQLLRNIDAEATAAFATHRRYS